MLLKQWLINQRPALGAGGRRFKSSRPDHLKQGLSGFPLGPFLLWVTIWVTNEGEIGLNTFLPVIEC